MHRTFARAGPPPAPATLSGLAQVPGLSAAPLTLSSTASLLQSSAQWQCGLECACFLFNVHFLHRTLGHRSTEAVLRAAFPALGRCPAGHCSVRARKGVVASPAVLSQGLRAGARGLSWASLDQTCPWAPPLTSLLSCGVPVGMVAIVCCNASCRINPLQTSVRHPFCPCKSPC